MIPMSADQNLPARADRGTPSLPPVAPDIPEPSAILRQALDVMLNPMVEVPHSDGESHFSRRMLPTLPAHIRDEAEAMLAAVRIAVTAGEISASDLIAWLGPIALGVKNPMPVSDLPAFAAVLEIVVEDLPRSVLSRESQRHALRTWRFFPSAAEVYELLSPPAKQWAQYRDGLMDVLRQATWDDA